MWKPRRNPFQQHAIIYRHCVLWQTSFEAIILFFSFNFKVLRFFRRQIGCKQRLPWGGAYKPVTGMYTSVCFFTFLTSNLAIAIVVATTSSLRSSLFVCMCVCHWGVDNIAKMVSTQRKNGVLFTFIAYYCHIYVCIGLLYSTEEWVHSRN